MRSAGPTELSIPRNEVGIITISRHHFRFLNWGRHLSISLRGFPRHLQPTYSDLKVVNDLQVTGEKTLDLVGLLGCQQPAGIAPSIPGLPGVTPQVPAGMTPVMSLVFSEV